MRTDTENRIYNRFFKSGKEGKSTLAQLLLTIPDKYRSIATLGYADGLRERKEEEKRK